MTIKELLDKLPEGWTEDTKIDIYSGTSLHPMQIISTEFDTEDHIVVEME